jgi:hypothetical protein
VKDDYLIADSAAFRAEVRRVDRLAPMGRGNVHRAWYQCPRCEKFRFRDYTPYSLSNPILTGCCGRFEDMRPVAVLKRQVGKVRREIEKIGTPPHRGEVRSRRSQSSGSVPQPSGDATERK